MSSTSRIEWTDTTWNPVTGCTRTSPGCDHCYAERMAKRLQAMGNPRYTNGFEPTLHWDKVSEPLKWRQPRRIFVNSMSDLFHEAADVRAPSTPWQPPTGTTVRAGGNVWLGVSSTGREPGSGRHSTPCAVGACEVRDQAWPRPSAVRKHRTGRTLTGTAAQHHEFPDSDEARSEASQDCW